MAVVVGAVGVEGEVGKTVGWPHSGADRSSLPGRKERKDRKNGHDAWQEGAGPAFAVGR